MDGTCNHRRRFKENVIEKWYLYLHQKDTDEILGQIIRKICMENLKHTEHYERKEDRGKH